MLAGVAPISWRVPDAECLLAEDRIQPEPVAQRIQPYDRAEFRQ